MTHYQNAKPHMYLPRAFKTDEGVVTLFQEDCGYYLTGDQALDAQGAQHRAFMYDNRPWEYVFSEQNI